jgi:hypothetical protein
MDLLVTVLKTPKFSELRAESGWPDSNPTPAESDDRFCLPNLLIAVQ